MICDLRSHQTYEYESHHSVGSFNNGRRPPLHTRAAMVVGDDAPATAQPELIAPALTGDSLMYCMCEHHGPSDPTLRTGVEGRLRTGVEGHLNRGIHVKIADRDADEAAGTTRYDTQTAGQVVAFEQPVHEYMQRLRLYCTACNLPIYTAPISAGGECKHAIVNEATSQTEMLEPSSLNLHYSSYPCLHCGELVVPIEEDSPQPYVEAALHACGDAFKFESCMLQKLTEEKFVDSSMVQHQLENALHIEQLLVEIQERDKHRRGPDTPLSAFFLSCWVWNHGDGIEELLVRIAEIGIFKGTSSLVVDLLEEYGLLGDSPMSKTMVVHVDNTQATATIMQERGKTDRMEATLRAKLSDMLDDRPILASRSSTKSDVQASVHTHGSLKLALYLDAKGGSRIVLPTMPLQRRQSLNQDLDRLFGDMNKGVVPTVARLTWGDLLNGQVPLIWPQQSVHQPVTGNNYTLVPVQRFNLTLNEQADIWSLFPRNKAKRATLARNNCPTSIVKKEKLELLRLAGSLLANSTTTAPSITTASPSESAHINLADAWEFQNAAVTIMRLVQYGPVEVRGPRVLCATLSAINPTAFTGREFPEIRAHSNGTRRDRMPSTRPSGDTATPPGNTNGPPSVLSRHGRRPITSLQVC